MSNPWDKPPQPAGKNPWDKPAPAAQPAPQQPAAPQTMSAGDVLGGAAQNLLPSLGKFAEGAREAITHPGKTVNALADVVQGAAEKLNFPPKPGGPDPKIEAPFNNLVKFFGDRYGGVENLKKTVATDPVGFLSDLATVFAGGGAALKVGGEVAEAANLGKTAEVLGTAAEGAKTAASFVDPVSLAGKTVGTVAKAPAKIAQEISGVLSGSGSAAIRKAFDTGKDLGDVGGRAEFIGQLRKITPERNILYDAVEGLHNMMDKKSEQYQKRLAQISKTQKKALDISPVAKETESQLKSSGVEYNLNKNGEFTDLDFSRSTLRGASETDVNQVKKFVDVVNEWGKKAEDRTPLGVDKLKRILDNFFFEDHKNARIVQAVKSSAREVLNQGVPGYKQMTSDYAKATNEIDQIKKSLSLTEQGGQVKNVDAALRKLNSILKENQEFRGQMAQKLQEAGGHDIEASVAGQSLSQLAPRGGIGRLALAGEGMVGIRHPGLLPLMAVSSPRVLGETAYLLGNVSGVGKKVAEVVQPAKTARAAFQVGRASEVSEPDSTSMLRSMGLTP